MVLFLYFLHNINGVIRLKISPLLLPLVVILVITDNIKIYLVAYFVMALHEFAHLSVAYLIGLKAEAITFTPFGVNLKLKSKIINTLSDEIILYSAGPLINGFFALISICFNNIVFYRLNIALFIMNLLPIIPLDGGMITLRLLSCRYGKKTSKKILNSFSVALGIGMLFIAIYLIIMGQINLSMFIISVFLIGNVLTGKEKYNTDLIDSLVSHKKYSNKTKITVINEDYSITDTIKEFSPSYTVFAILTDKEDKSVKILSEKEIIEKYQLENLTL